VVLVVCSPVEAGAPDESEVVSEPVLEVVPDVAGAADVDVSVADVVGAAGSVPEVGPSWSGLVVVWAGVWSLGQPQRPSTSARRGP